MRPRTPMNMKGDRSKRVTVPLPQALNDLRSTARSHFASGGGQLKMYHKGEKLEQQNQIRRLVDNDVVIVRQETPDNYGYPPPKTTNQSTYVQHPIERKQASGPRIPQGSDMKPPAFEGRSCYVADYVEHPVESPERKKKPTAAWEASGIPMTARSAYAESYPWHDTQRRPQTRPAQKEWDANPAPFHGQSSYKTDYIKREAERPKSAKPGPKMDTATLPFNGTTTYTVDFKEPPLSRTERAHQRKNESGPSLPFQGTSEYKNEYLARELARAARVHLEPEDRRRSSEIQRNDRRSR